METIFLEELSVFSPIFSPSDFTVDSVTQIQIQEKS